MIFADFKAGVDADKVEMAGLDDDLIGGHHIAARPAKAREYNSFNNTQTQHEQISLRKRPISAKENIPGHFGPSRPLNRGASAKQRSH